MRGRLPEGSDQFLGIGEHPQQAFLKVSVDRERRKNGLWATRDPAC